MGSHRILELTDAALVAYLISEGAGTADDVFPSKSVGDKSLPCTICEAGSWGSPDGMEYTGNSEVSAVVTVKTAGFISDSATTIDDSGSRVSATFDSFYNPDPQALGAAITAAAEAAGLTMTCIACRVTGGDRSFEGGAWMNSINLDLLCCPSALT